MPEDDQGASNQQGEQSAPSDEMRVDPARAKELVENLSKITKRINSAAQGRPVRLLAISKLKPASDILALHDPSAHLPKDSTASNPEPHPPQLHFGENYAQELVHKASLLPRSIRWHFTGGLQTNKCKDLARIPNLWSVESVDSVKKADALEKARKAWAESEHTPPPPSPSKRAAPTPDGGEDEGDRLGIHIQINTSGEESKSGVSPGPEATTLCRHVLDHCPHLILRGVMTIGAIARSETSTTPEGINEDFTCLKQTRDRVVRELREGESQDDEDGVVVAWNGVELELSMGMSADFEDAIAQGSQEVRVGSQIFGERPAKADQAAKQGV